MAKAYPVSQAQYALVLRNADDNRINSSVSARDLDGTRDLARSILRITPEAATVEIYPYVPGQELAGEPLETVSLDDE